MIFCHRAASLGLAAARQIERLLGQRESAAGVALLSARRAARRHHANREPAGAGGAR
jgi:hypothetical protein